MNEAAGTEPARWISTAQAARSSGLNRDYIAQLCRVGKVRGEFIGKNWYLEPESFDTFLIETESTKAQRRAAAAIERKAALSSGIAKEIWESRRKKLLALTLAVVLTVGAAALASATTRAFAIRSANDFSAAAHGAYDALVHRSAGAQSALVAAAADPTGAFAQFRDTLIGNVGARTHAAQLAAAASPLDALLSWVDHFLFPNNYPSPAPTATAPISAASSAKTHTAQLAAAAVSQTPTSTTPHISYLSSAGNSTSSGTARTTSTPSSQQQPNATPAQQHSTVPSARQFDTPPQPISSTVPGISSALAISGNYISADVLNQKLSELDNKLSSRIYQLTSANSAQTAAVYNVAAQTNAINQLSNIPITNPTITRGSVSGASVSATSLSAGATTLGDTTLASATVSGSLTVGGTASFSTLTSYVAPVAPYFTATSTSATSTFAGLLSVGTSSPWGSGLFTVGTSSALLYVDNSSGKVGVGTSSPGSLFSVGGNILGAGSLALSGTTGTTTIAAGQGFTIGSSQFVLQQGSGNVGIGTTTPGSILAIQNVGNFVASATSTLFNGLQVPTLNTTGISTFGALALFNGGATSTTFNANTAAVGTLTGGSGTFSSTVGVSGLSTLTNASTSLLSVYGPAYFGATATSTFGADGSLTLNGSLTANGNTTLTNATTTSLSVKSLLSAPNATIGALTATSTLAVSNTASFFGTSSFGATATSSFNNAGALTLASALGVGSGGTGWANINAGSILFGNGASALATSSNLFWDNTNNRLGIGTTTPGSILSVQGIANFTAATSTFYSTGGLNLAAGCFAINSNCLSLGNISGTLAANQGGTGANSFVQGWIYSNGGTGALAASTSPTVNYVVATSTTLASIFPYASTTALTASGTGFFGLGQFANTTGTTTLAAGQGFTIGSSQFVLQQGSGNVGIGTASPGTKLNVQGTFGLPSTSGSNAADTILRVNNTAAGATGATLDIGQDGSAGAWLQSRSGGDYTTNYPLMLNPNGGNVGIGTTTPLVVNGNTPAGTGLHIANTSGIGTSILDGATGAQFLINNSGQATNSRLWREFATGGDLQFASMNDALTVKNQTLALTAAGNVGIGTTTPKQLLNVVAVSNSLQIPVQITNTNLGAGVAALGFDVTGGTDTNFGVAKAGIGFQRAAVGGLGDLNFYNRNNADTSNFTSSDIDMVIKQSGSVGIGTTSPIATLSVNGPIALGSNGGIYGPSIYNGSGTLTIPGGTGGIQFNTQANNAALVNILNNGNVGIGTTSPNSKLVVAGSATYAGQANVAAIIGVGTANDLLLGSTNGNSPFIASQGASPLLFYTNAAERMRLDSSGNVGIGTTSPLTSLYVQKTGTLPVGIEGTTQSDIGFYNAAGTLAYSLGRSLNSDNAQDFFFYDNTNGATRLAITNGGNVGIGTTSPQSALAVSGGVSIGADYNTAAPTNGIIVEGTSHFGSPSVGVSKLSVAVASANDGLGVFNTSVSGTKGWELYPVTNGSNTDMRLYEFSGANGDRMTFQSGGNVGIGTTSPAYKLTVDNAGSAGVVAGFENSSGECTINPTSSSVNCSSDITLKKNITPISTSTALSDILALNPVFFNWNAEATGTPQHSGFIAQQVQPILPDLVSQGDSGKLLLNYAGLTPYLAGAIQAQQADFDALTATTSTTTAGAQAFAANFYAALFARLTQWLGDASNGIENLFAKNIYADNITTHKITADELCAGSVCVNQQQLAALLAGQGSTTASGTATSPSSAAPPAGGSTPPVIQINGNNPATIQVGETYNDLGATITGPTQDLNLGLKTFLNGTLVSQIQIDTSQAATDTINYVATDGAGNTSTSTRTLIIQAAAGASAATPSTPAASSTAATSTTP